MKKISILLLLCILVLFSCENYTEEYTRIEEECISLLNQNTELLNDLETIRFQNDKLNTDLSKSKDEISQLKQELSDLEESLNLIIESNDNDLFNYDNETQQVLTLLIDLYKFNTKFFGPDSFAIDTKQDHEIYMSENSKLLNEWYMIEFEGDLLTISSLRDTLKLFYNKATVNAIMDDIPEITSLDDTDNIHNTTYVRYSEYILMKWLSIGYDFQTKYLINETQLINKTVDNNTVSYVALTPVVSYDETGKNIVDYNLKKYEVVLEKNLNHLLFKQIPEIN